MSFEAFVSNVSAKLNKVSFKISSGMRSAKQNAEMFNKISARRLTIGVSAFVVGRCDFFERDGKGDDFVFELVIVAHVKGFEVSALVVFEFVVKLRVRNANLRKIIAEFAQNERQSAVIGENFLNVAERFRRNIFVLRVLSRVACFIEKKLGFFAAEFADRYFAFFAFP